MGQYILALDQGTTSSRAILFDKKGNSIAVSQKETKLYYPESGWVEQDVKEIWNSQYEVAKETLKKAGIPQSEVAAIGITNQRETTIVWDKSTGEPVYRAIVWQCRRTADECKMLCEAGYRNRIQEITGLLVDPYFSATKLRWILNNVEGAREKAETGELLFGTVDTYLIWKLSGGKVHCTDVSNASRTMLFDIHELKWSKELLDLFEIPESMLPKVVDNSGQIAETKEELFSRSIPICGVAGDQQAALFGQACFQKGMVKNTYGTGGFLLMNTGEEPSKSKNGLLTTVGWKIGDKVTYALEGSVFVCGAAVQWLRDQLQIIQKASDTEEIAQSVEDNGGVYFVPAFVGIGAPYWNPDVRGTIVGLTRGTGRGHIVRATLEAMAYQTMDVVSLMEQEAGCRVAEIRVDGGACVNDFLMQFQADMTSVNVIRPQCVETTALGAAYLAGLGVGMYKDLDEIQSMWKVEKRFIPQMSVQKIAKNKQGWSRAIGMTIGGTENV